MERQERRGDGEKKFAKWKIEQQARMEIQVKRRNTPTGIKIA